MFTQVYYSTNVTPLSARDLVLAHRRGDITVKPLKTHCTCGKLLTEFFVREGNTVYKKTTCRACAVK